MIEREDAENRTHRIESKLDALAVSVDERFQQVDERFTQVDERFNQVDERFKQVDERFNQVDERFKQVDKRFDALSAEMIAQHEETRRYFTITVEQLIAERNLVLDQSTANAERLENHEKRISALERRRS
jgi:archaellum component FlaC